MPDVDPVREPDAPQPKNSGPGVRGQQQERRTLAGVLLRDATEPESRNPDDLIVVPLLLSVLSVAFAVPAVLLTVATLARRERLGARASSWRRSGARWCSFGVGGWVLVVAAG